MTQEPIPGSGGNSAGRSSSARRGRANRNRPVLITSTPEISDQLAQNGSGEDQLISPDGANETSTMDQASEETTTGAPRSRRLPKFFSTVGKSEEKQADQPEVNQARIARATVGKKITQTKEGKQPVASVPAKSAPAKAAPTRSAPARPPGAFKMKYIIGMLLYLIIADVIGSFETTYLTANHLNNPLFSIGSFPVTPSTVLFLLTLIVVLIVLARFDLIPRNLAGLGGRSPAQGRTGQSKSTSEPGSPRSQPPAMKQGVKGADDDLYQEYRAQQRYNQRRERKR